MSWHYICVLVDLFNREIIGYRAGRNKDANLVSKAFSRVNVNLEKIQIFHTERGNEFKNKTLDETLKTFHITHVDKCNESKVQTRVNRECSDPPQYHVVVSDLTYVRVGNSWNSICVLVDLFHREIIGFSTGKNKDAILVEKAFSRVNVNLKKIQIFHTDRGNEFKNKLLDETVASFPIQRSLSMKGCPYDNAVAEATFKIIKTEFIRGQTYETLEHLQYELADYVNWFNNHRIHSSLGYLTPNEYRLTNLKKVV